MKLADKPILITGAEGFIGAHLVERLVTGGADEEGEYDGRKLEQIGADDTSNRDRA